MRIDTQNYSEIPKRKKIYDEEWKSNKMDESEWKIEKYVPIKHARYWQDFGFHFNLSSDLYQKLEMKLVSTLN